MEALGREPAEKTTVEVRIPPTTPPFASGSMPASPLVILVAANPRFAPAVSKAQIDVSVLVGERVGISHLELKIRSAGSDSEDHLSLSRYTGVHVLQK